MDILLAYFIIYNDVQKFPAVCDVAFLKNPMKSKNVMHKESTCTDIRLHTFI